MPIVLTGAALTPEQLLAIVDGTSVECDPDALARVEQSHATAVRVTGRRAVYGRSTGVGANLDVAGGGLAVLRSHAGGAGALLPADQARAMMAVRLNQLLAGASGVHPRVLRALAAAINDGAVPAIHEYGSIGTGDITALAELGLKLLGERPWASGASGPVEFEPGDALAFISSSALTIGQSALASMRLGALSQAALLVAVLTAAALGASGEAFAEQVHAARPHPGSVEVARRVRALLPAASSTTTQDPYGVRALPQVDGELLRALAALREVLLIELNAGAENPFVGADDVFHHGGWHQAPLTAALDSVRLALLGTAQLSGSRLAALVAPLRGAPPFLAAGPGASGVLVLEYTAASAVADLRALAMPAALGHAVVSLGVESHASFASQAARQALGADGAFRIAIAAELVCAVRALRGAGRDLAPLAGLLEVCADLPAEIEDRPLDGDLELAVKLLDDLART